MTYDDDGDSNRIRTYDRRIRNPMLYPAELWSQHTILYHIIHFGQAGKVANFRASVMGKDKWRPEQDSNLRPTA